eukprot:356995-Chlamydomonas_euryale.AAC.24
MHAARDRTLWVARGTSCQRERGQQRHGINVEMRAGRSAVVASVAMLQRTKACTCAHRRCLCNRQRLWRRRWRTQLAQLLVRRSKRTEAAKVAAPFGRSHVDAKLPRLVQQAGVAGVQLKARRREHLQARLAWQRVNKPGAFTGFAGTRGHSVRTAGPARQATLAQQMWVGSVPSWTYHNFQRCDTRQLTRQASYNELRPPAPASSLAAIHTWHTCASVAKLAGSYRRL